jgi:hypothetical protein
VSVWAEVFLGVIAFATLTMAVIQLAAVVYGWTMAKRLNRLMSEIEREMKPLSQSLNAIARDASRVTSLAAGQVERIDRLITDLTDRIEETASTVQAVLLRPLREGAALLSGIKAAIDVFRDLTRRSGTGRPRPEEEDALFIG